MQALIMRRVIATIISILVILIIITPSVALAESAESTEPINIIDVGRYEGNIGASESIKFYWVLYNSGTNPYLVKINPVIINETDGMSTSVTENHIVLDPGQHQTITVTLDASQGVPTHQSNLVVNFEMKDLNSPLQAFSISKTASVSVTALFDKGGAKIFVWENNLPAPLNSIWGTFLIVLLIWIIIASIIHLIIFPLARRIARMSKFGISNRILRIIRMPTLIVITTYGLIDSLGLLPISASTHVILWQIYRIITISVIAWATYRIFNDIIIDFAEKWAKRTENGIDDVLVPLLQKIGMLIIPIFAIGAALSVVGIDLTLAVASLGVVGLVVGLAAQHSLGNLFSGLLLMLDRPFRVGDVVKLETGEICRVLKVGLRTTQLHSTFQNSIITLPNDMLANRKVENWSRPDNRHSQGTEVRVAYGTDLEKVHKLLLQVADEHPDVVKEPSKMPYVRTARLGETAVDFKLWYWVDVANMWRVASDMRIAVEKKLRQEGIEIPFPQSVVTLYDSSSRRD
ncbi:MAG: mechanosensitive ion channel family protein [Euryarchaeota archaeon]|nr:mechanosensitive ion channel family protein [Euryarchaeota archaeon]